VTSVGEEPTTEVEEEDDDPLNDLTERLDAFNALRKNDEAAADELFDQIAGHGQVERDIVSQMAVRRPLRRPDRFDEAHRLTMRGLEVLDRNGLRSPKLPNIGPLKPVASYFVGLLNRWIVRSYQKRVIENLRDLYLRRESECIPNTDEIRQLRRARIQTERLVPGYRKEALGLPAFLLGGAVISFFTTLLQRLVTALLDNPWLLAAVSSLATLLCLCVAWAGLRAAAVSRRRIKLSTDIPLRALYDAIGSCGNPPKADAMMVALWAIIISAIAWLSIPIGIGFAIAR
jgi:hypothetical protein